MNNTLRAALCVAGLVVATQAAAQVTFYAREGFRGPSFTADGTVRNFDRAGFNDVASSAVVNGGQWQVCEDARFSGRCVVLQPGQYDSLRAMGLDNAVSSVRPVDAYSSNDGRRVVADAYPANGGYVDNRGYAGSDQGYAGNDRDRWARRQDERLFDVPVTSVHAVVGPPEQRCWVERQDVSTGGGANVPGAVIGGVIGGILGHQVGAGHGREAATVGGAVAGAAIGGNVNREPEGVASQDVQRCDYAPTNARPDFWDVTYNFRGIEHHVQMSAPPGATITVNADGEPRM